MITTTCGSDGAPILENKAVCRCVDSSASTLRTHPFRRPGTSAVGAAPRSIIHVHIAHAFVPEVVFLTSMLRRRRSVAHFHADIDPTGPLGFLLKSYKRWILGPSLRRADAVIALSPASRFLEPSRRVPAVAVLPNGVDPAFYRPLEDAKESVVRQRPLRILNVGRWIPARAC